MNRLLQYPFDPAIVLKKRRSIKKSLLEDGDKRIVKRIAVLGGSTTHDIVATLELFLLDFGIEPVFYESEYGLYFEDAMFGEELESFKPDLVFIHTSFRNITRLPHAQTTKDEATAMISEQFDHFRVMWERLSERFGCPVIQNNFEMPFYRLLGNRDAYDHRGFCRFASALNEKFAEWACTHDGFYINDINYLSADYGLRAWSDPLYYHMYKYCMTIEAIPAFAYNLACIIKSIYGKNKKALVLDLDNTLWGGVVGDDGVDGIEIGHETSVGQAYSEFQEYLSRLREYGIMLNVDSKNDYENAIAGLNHPEGTLKPSDFICIKANWEPKDMNFEEIARELNILPESMVFVDDNPAERAIVTSQIPGVCAPPVDAPEHYIAMLDRGGFFEMTEISNDDLSRNEMYKANVERAELKKSFSDYNEYLMSLDMHATIKPFEQVYIQRIAQLTNKSNQFNLTTRRYTDVEMEAFAEDDEYITLYGKLSDKFGDNGVISVVLGHINGSKLDITLWLMSCRVLKRNMECAMLDMLVDAARKHGVKTLVGYYYKSAKNSMVKNFYRDFGFSKVSENGEDTIWELDITDYKNKNEIIKINEE